MAGLQMQTNARELGVFLELRRKLHTGLLIVRKEGAGRPADVVVTGGDSALCVQTPQGDLSLALPPGVTLEPGSCVPTSAGDSCGEELHYRLRLDVAASAEEEPSDSVMETLRPKETYCFHCQGCMTRLLEDRAFKRVLPLPNGNWNAIVDDWCCHSDPFAKEKLKPRAEDCLLGDTFLLLARDDGCDQTLAEEVSPVSTQDGQDPKKPCRRLALLSCRSCAAEVGEAFAPGILKLYFTQVWVEPAAGDRKSDASISRSVFVERTIAARLLELSNSLSTFHFSVQTPDEKPFLLLWLLNSDSMVASVPRTRDGAFDSPSAGAPGAARALKVLYVACSNPGVKQRDIVTIWEVNVIGHPVVLPQKVCEELQEVIDDSNSTLPASMRHMRSYEVAYLRL